MHGWDNSNVYQMGINWSPIFDREGLVYYLRTVLTLTGAIEVGGELHDDITGAAADDSLAIELPVFSVGITGSTWTPPNGTWELADRWLGGIKSDGILEGSGFFSMLW